MAEQVSVVDGHLGGQPQLLFAAGKQGRQQVVADGLAGAQAQLAAWLGIGAEQVLDILHPGQQLFGGRLQQAPLVVELQSGVNAVKQRGGELALQLLQRLGDGPLAQAELVGGKAKVSVAGNGGEHFQLLQGQFHAVWFS